MSWLSIGIGHSSEHCPSNRIAHSDLPRSKRAFGRESHVVKRADESAETGRIRNGTVNPFFGRRYRRA